MHSICGGHAIALSALRVFNPHLVCKMAHGEQTGQDK